MSSVEALGYRFLTLLNQSLFSCCKALLSFPNLPERGREQVFLSTFETEPAWAWTRSASQLEPDAVEDSHIGSEQFKRAHYDPEQGYASSDKGEYSKQGKQG